MWQCTDILRLTWPPAAPGGVSINRVLILLATPIVWLQAWFVIGFLVRASLLIGQDKRFLHYFLVACCAVFGLTALALLAMKVAWTISGTEPVFELRTLLVVMFLSTASLSYHSLLALPHR